MPRKSILLLMLLVSACSFQVQMVTPETVIVSTPSPVQPSVLTLTSTVIPVSTITANPTDVFIATKSAGGNGTVVPPKDTGTNPIRFAPNGTYVDIIDSIAVGTSKTYSLHALKGQIMSVSVHQGSNENWTMIPMKVRGTDGATLCPTNANMACYFWRGVLPATQDYFVTLMPDIDVSDFMLRVAINPPGMATQFFLYESHDRRAMFQYSDEFAPVRFSDIPIYKIGPEITLEFINSEFYTNTNLVEAYFLYGSTTEAGIVSSCTQPLSSGAPETVIDHVTLNGVDFVHSEATGVAAGNLYDTIYYRTLHDNICYEITFLIHSGNIGNYPPDSGIKEFDRAALMQKMEGILSTLVIK